MTNKDLIKQYVDTGVPIPESQYLKLSPNDKKTYIRKRKIAIKSHQSQLFTIKRYELFKIFEEDEQIIDFFSKIISTLENYFGKLFEETYTINEYNEKIINKFLSFPSLLKDIKNFQRRYNILNNIIQSYSDKNKIIEKLFSIDENVGILYTEDLPWIIRKHSNKKEIIENLLEKYYFLNKFNEQNRIFIFLSTLLNENELFEILLKNKKIFKLLYDTDIATSLLHSNEKNREKIKQLWIDIGFSKQTINDIIKRFNIKTELIG